MRTLLIGALIIGSLSCRGQNDSKENMILQLVKKAVVVDKMPSEVVNIKDSTEYPHTVVVIHASKENGLKPGVYLKPDEIDYRIWSGEELFTYDVYWIVPSNIKLDNNKGSFEFVTRYGSTKQKQCYGGSINGKRENGEWILVNSTYRKKKCQFDLKTMYE